jgi:hypothetical protein
MTLQMALMLQLVVKTLKLSILVLEVHNTNTAECHWLLTFAIATKRAMNTTGSLTFIIKNQRHYDCHTLLLLV